MKEVINVAKAKLVAGELSIGVGLRQARTVDIAAAMKTAGMDWLFIDMEHNAMSIDTAVQISVTALNTGIAPLVRVPIGDYSIANRALDGGALGIVMPHVQTAGEARRMVAELRFPPEGHRGVSGAMPQFDYARVNLGEAIETLNRELLLIPMLETQEAIDQAEEIASIDGIDVVMIGTNDLATAMGYPGQFGHERVVAAYETVGAACVTHGKWMGMGGVSDTALVQQYVGMGVRFILTGNDINFMIAGATQKATALRDIKLS